MVVVDAPPAVRAPSQLPPGALRADIARTLVQCPGGRLRRVVACAIAPGVHVVIVMRFGQWLLDQPRPVRLALDPLYYAGHYASRIVWGIDVPRKTRIGPGLYIGHFGGIIVSAQSSIGANCDLSHGVTVGVGGKGDRLGAPEIGDNVYLGPGAKVFGRINVGRGAKIGANAVVFRDVPEDAVAVLHPGFRILSPGADEGADDGAAVDATSDATWDGTTDGATDGVTADGRRARSSPDAPSVRQRPASPPPGPRVDDPDDHVDPAAKAIYSTPKR